MPWPPPLSLDTERAKSIVVCAILFPTLATLSVVGRFFSRHMKKAHYGADDWVILPALLAVYAQMIIIILSVFYGGVGHHAQDLSKDNFVAFYKLIAAVQFSFGTSLGLAKISLCFLLVRIFFVREFRIAAWCVMLYCACWTIMVISIGAGLCRPFAFNWDKSISGGKCGALDPAYISIAALDIVGDAMIIALPMPWVWKLKTSTAAKIGLSAVFALGFLDIIVSILRIVYLVNTDYSPTADFTWESTGTYVWSVIEPSLAVIVACAAVLRPLFSSWIPKLHSTRSGGYSAKFGRDKAAYSDISNGEFPLRPLGAFNSTTAGSGDSHIESGEVGVATTSLAPPVAAHHSSAIRVKNEISVKSTPKDDMPEDPLPLPVPNRL